MTAPQVTIAADEWTDLRYDTLARLLRLPGGRDHALILCMRIRSWQTEHYTPEAPTYCIEPAMADGVLGDGGAAALVRARLAVETPSGLHIVGSDNPGRIDWLYRLQDNGRKRKSKHKEVAPAQAAAPAPAKLQVDSSSSYLPEEDLPPARVAPATAPAPSGEDQQRARRRAITTELWRELGATRAAIAAELGVEARPLPAIGDSGERALAMRLASTRSEAELAEVVESARHVIAMAAAEARAPHKRSVEWLTGALFEDRSWRRATGMTVDDAARPRAGPRGSAERASEPTRRVKTL